jgi:glycosyltransferase involved in cell wall biosynthesis
MHVSIITPSRNSEKYIENNLKSIHLEQKGDFSLEQIIVDANSTDKTVEIIKSFQEEHQANIKLIQGKDKNMYDAINKGMKAMKGDIWACLNTDDLYYPNTIQTAINEFNSNPELEVVYGYPDMIDVNGNFIHTLYLPKFNLDFLVHRGYCLTILQPASFLRKTVIDKIGFFDIDYNYASDYDYFIRVGANCKMKLIKKSFTQFREHPDAITCNMNTRSVQTEESDAISQKYMKKYGIDSRSIFYDNICLYALQLKPANFPYAYNKIKKVTSAGEWKCFLKERIL